MLTIVAGAVQLEAIVVLVKVRISAFSLTCGSHWLNFHVRVLYRWKVLLRYWLLQFR